MRSVLSSLALVALAAATLAGCAAEPATPDSAEIQAWAAGAQQRWADETTAVGMISGATGSAATGDEPGTSLNFADPQAVTSVLFTCFGEGNVTLAIKVTSADGTVSLGDNTVPCADGDYEVDLTAHELRAATQLEISDAGADRPGYWSAIVRGTPANG